MRIDVPVSRLFRGTMLVLLGALVAQGWTGCGGGGLRRTGDSGTGGASSALGGSGGIASGTIGTGGTIGEGGTFGTGRGAPTGGGSGGGGLLATGGSTGSGGFQSAGGVPGTGGVPVGTGGVTGTGGILGTGGQTIADRFVVSPDGLTVMDLLKRLIWQRDGFGERPGCSGNIWGDPASGDVTCTWSEAQTYCAKLTLGDTSWRTPTVRELESIVDSTRTTPPVLNLEVFPDPAGTIINTQIRCFWTSTELFTGLRAQSVDFYFGGPSNTGETDYCRVRCVHSQP